MLVTSNYGGGHKAITSVYNGPFEEIQWLGSWWGLFKSQSDGAIVSEYSLQ